VALSSHQINQILRSHQLRSPDRRSHTAHQSTPQLTYLIGECFYDRRASVWRVYKIRYDKATSNSLSAAWSNLEVISEAIELQTLITSLGQLSPQLPDHRSSAVSAPPPSQLAVPPHSSSQLETIDNHYNHIQIQRHTAGGSRDQRIAMHRKVMNWSKACLLQQTLFPARLSSPSLDQEQYRSLVHQLLSDIHSYSSTDKAPSAHVPNLLKKSHWHPNSRKGRGNNKPQINVVDLACGRGGDIKKFTSKSLNPYAVSLDS
jgi:hypothetical protein